MNLTGISRQSLAQNRHSLINKNVPKRPNHVWEKEQEIIAAGKRSACVAAGARARRCELCDGVADRGPPNGGYAGNVAERRFAAIEIGSNVKAADRSLQQFRVERSTYVGLPKIYGT